MDSDKVLDPYEDNRETERSRQSLRSSGKESQVSFLTPKRDKSKDVDKDISAGDRARTRVRDPDPDQDRMSDGGRQRRSSGSLYSEDYDNASPSERSLSSYSRTPSPSPRKGVCAKRVSGSPFYKKAHPAGVRRGAPRPHRQQQQPRLGARSQSKDSSAPTKDLDLVTKRMLSARLLKIDELRNALAELQQRTDQLHKENRVLRQLQLRQEKALQRYDDTESEIAQLLSRHANETQSLRERLRRAQERERAAERRLKDNQEQLQRSQAALSRLRKLADQQELGPREELNHRLEQESSKAQEAERRIKELERSLELSSSSFQRQLAGERRKTMSAQEEVKALQDQMELLSNKLKEKERELDTRNIYANRMFKPTPRKDTYLSIKNKAPSRSSTKAVQTDERVLSPDFPSPPPAATLAIEDSPRAPDDYLSLKELGKSDRKRTQTEDRMEQETRREEVKERDMGNKELEWVGKLKLEQQLNALEQKAKILRDGWEKEKDQEVGSPNHSLSQKEEQNGSRRGQVQDELERRGQEALVIQRAAEGEQRRKAQLLAKLQEIDQQSEPLQDSSMFSEAHNSSPTNQPSSHLNESTNHTPSFFSFTEPQQVGDLRASAGSRDVGRKSGGLEGATGTGIGRRGMRTQMSSEDLAFGSYAPSFGRPAARGASGVPIPPALEASQGSGTGPGKERKSNLMQQLFGAPSTPPASSTVTSTMDVLRSPPVANGGRSKREGLLSFEPEHCAPSVPILSTLHVVESKPAVRALPSFDDDIEELAL